MDAAPSPVGHVCNVPEASGTLQTCPTTVGSIIDAYLAHRRGLVARDGYSAKALENAVHVLGNFAAHFGHKPIDACKRHDVTVWLGANSQWKAGDTINNALAMLLACFGWAADEDLIPASPYKNIRHLKRRRGHRRPASVTEYITLMRFGSRPLRRSIFFMRRSSARTCEMREAVFGDIHWALGVMALYKHKTARATGKPRIIGLEPGLLRFLRNLYRQSAVGSRQEAEGNGGNKRTRTPRLEREALLSSDCQLPAADCQLAEQRIFTNNEGGAWDVHTYARHFRRTADRLGLDRKLSGYCLRHSFGTWSVEAGAGIKQVADLMGHADVRTTEGYLSTLRTKAPYLQEQAAEVLRLQRLQRRAGRPAQPDLFDPELPFGEK
jgi:site-specific recombinase XerD